MRLWHGGGCQWRRPRDLSQGHRTKEVEYGRHGPRGVLLVRDVPQVIVYDEARAWDASLQRVSGSCESVPVGEA